MKTWKKWTEEESERLKFHWRYSNMEDLMREFPDRTYQSLMKQASVLGVKSQVQRKRQGSFSFLRKLNPQSCYWWGFIMADGHLSRRGEFSIQLNIQDKEHLQKLASHLECELGERRYINTYTNKESHSCILRLGDKEFCNEWLDTLNIHSPKTYTPPDLSIFLNHDLFIYFMIGFIDGDGCIWHTKTWDDKLWINLKIELHKNWINVLETFSVFLESYGIKSKVYLSKKQTACLTITKKESFEVLKNYFPRVDYLERKWNKLSIL